MATMAELEAQVQQLREQVEDLRAELHAAPNRRVRVQIEEGPQGPPGKDGPPGRDIDTEAVIRRIRSDRQLQELLRGPQGRPGLDGKPGPQGDAGSTVIRERGIVG